MASVEKMSRNTAESINDAGMDIKSPKAVFGASRIRFRELRMRLLPA
jgi:hypothetical protein